MKPCFLARSLGEPRPDKCNEKDPQVLEKETPAEAKGLNDEVVEEVVGGSW